MDETDQDSIARELKRICEHCGRREGRFIHRWSTAFVHGVDWQCLSCYERQDGFKVKEYVRFCTVIEDRTCRLCGGKGCKECKKIHCGYVGCTSFVQVEHHHYAPSEFFGPEADLYPVLPLCREHHEHWHKVINARIKYKYD